MRIGADCTNWGNKSIEIAQYNKEIPILWEIENKNHRQFNNIYSIISGMGGGYENYKQCDCELSNATQTVIGSQCKWNSTKLKFKKNSKFQKKQRTQWK